MSGQTLNRSGSRVLDLAWEILQTSQLTIEKVPHPSALRGKWGMQGRAKLPSC